ncbi:hypothetical protein ABW19_dt0206395 [Dactylella cylindrospora]|nr:hypothetical protein ABW19_dt0206395 [Dactylella cylindrospora]
MTINATLWHDSQRSRVLLYGGAFQNSSGEVDAAPQVIWSFDIIQGRWSAVTTNGDTPTRATSGASCYMDGIGYYRGGQQDAFTTPDYPGSADFELLSGMRTYNMTSRRFSEETTGFEVFGDPISKGYRQGVLIPITLAGSSYLINYGGGGKLGAGLSMENVYIYDIQNQIWYIQPTAGDAPQNTRGMCAVAATASDGSSVNIYNYGGVIYDNSAKRFTQSNQMWILSIPAFQWIQVDKTDDLKPGGLQDHTCHLHDTNMLVIGGRDFSQRCDRTPVKIFNVSTLKWEPEFLAAAPKYTVPYEIFDIIGGNASGFSSWDDKPYIQPPDPSSPFFNAEPVAPPSKPSSQGRDGIIAGSTIGGIAAVGLILSIYLLRKDRKPKKQQIRLIEQAEFRNERFAGVSSEEYVLEPSSDPHFNYPPPEHRIQMPRAPDRARRFWPSIRRTSPDNIPRIPGGLRAPERREEFCVVEHNNGQGSMPEGFGSAYQTNTRFI